MLVRDKINKEPSYICRLVDYKGTSTLAKKDKKILIDDYGSDAIKYFTKAQKLYVEAFNNNKKDSKTLQGAVQQVSFENEQSIIIVNIYALNLSNKVYPVNTIVLKKALHIINATALQTQRTVHIPYKLGVYTLTEKSFSNIILPTIISEFKDSKTKCILSTKILEK